MPDPSPPKTGAPPFPRPRPLPSAEPPRKTRGEKATGRRGGGEVPSRPSRSEEVADGELEHAGFLEGEGLEGEAPFEAEGPERREPADGHSVRRSQVDEDVDDV